MKLMAAKEPFFSIVIPTYNRASFVTKAIGSVMNQTFTDYEIIVVDDGSTDSTRTSLQGYAENIRYIYQNNSGVSAARNTGIKSSNGKWIAFLDSDDQWRQDYLAVQAEQIRMFPNAIAHITNGITLLPDGQRSNLFVETKLLSMFKAQQCLEFEKPLQTIIKHGAWFIQTTVLRRDILLKIGLFKTDLTLAEDLDVIGRFALEGPLTIRKEELAEVYRGTEIEHLMDQCIKRGIYRFQAFGTVYKNILDSGQLSWVEKATVARVLSSNRRALGNVLVMADRVIEGRKFYKEALFLYPSAPSLIKFMATFLSKKISRALIRNGSDILPGNDAV
jgi:glycosyltransferase involved in cell wall biosynthesis